MLLACPKTNELLIVLSNLAPYSSEVINQLVTVPGIAGTKQGYGVTHSHTCTVAGRSRVSERCGHTTNQGHRNGNRNHQCN